MAINRNNVLLDLTAELELVREQKYELAHREREIEHSLVSILASSEYAMDVLKLNYRALRHVVEDEKLRLSKRQLKAPVVAE